MRCRSLAEMPVRLVDISNTARNYAFKGFFVFSSSVREVRLVWCPQSAHLNRNPSRSVHTRVLGQRAQAGLPLHRASIPVRTTVLLGREPRFQRNRRHGEITPQIVSGYVVSWPNSSLSS